MIIINIVILYFKQITHTQRQMIPPTGTQLVSLMVLFTNTQKLCLHVWQEKMTRIQAAHVNSVTMKTLTDSESVSNCMMPRLKIMFNYDERTPVLPYNNV